MTESIVSEILRKLPDSPGVYLMKDSGGTIIYVGKAASLAHRVRSYFASGDKLTPKIARMVSQVADIEFFVTATEQDALILELNLIKRFHPHYNVRLKDDKTFPYLKVTLNEEWPRVCFTRRMVEDGGRYFGPFSNARSVRDTLTALKDIFPIRSCNRPILPTGRRACLEYHMNRCLAPCTGNIDPEEYREIIREVILMLEGKSEIVVDELKKRMEIMSENLNFEKAAILRDRIESINRIITDQKATAAVQGDQDVIAFAQDRDMACVQVFFVRGGKLIGRESFTMQGTRSEEPRQVMTGFVKQFYASAPYVPPLLVLQYPVEETAIIKEWLRRRRGSRVDIIVPHRGNRKTLIDTVAENARQGLEQLKIKSIAAPKTMEAALAGLQKELNLPAPPSRIEGYDISNIQGTDAVGSMVVFEEGRSRPAHYRRFKIKTVQGADDYAMLKEVLYRRFKHIREADSTAWAIKPDLILIDGGRGQLNAAIEALSELGVIIPTASLAKQREEIFIPGKTEPLALPRNDPALQLLQRVRDEAHRFAIGYHLKTHRKEAFVSALDIQGIGPRRRRALLRHFGSVELVREASLEEIASVKGMTAALAKKVKENL